MNVPCIWRRSRASGRRAMMVASRPESVRQRPAVELAVFAHGMSNFSHNRATPAAQPRLLQEALGDAHGLQGIFDDSGNFAIVTAADARTLATDVIVALNREYAVKGVVVVPKLALAQALADLERAVSTRFGRSFRPADYSVMQPCGRWRVGFVLMDSSAGLDARTRIALDRGFLRLV